MGFFKSLFSTKDEDPGHGSDASRARDFDVLKYDGIRALRSGQAGYAARCFTHALGIMDDLEVREHLSAAYVSTGEYANAYEQLAVILGEQPGNVNLMARMANVAYLMEDYDLMMETCEKAMSLDGGVPEVMFLYARACIGKGSPAEGVEALTKAIALNPQYFAAYLLRAETLFAQGDLDGADRDATLLYRGAEAHEDVLMLKARIARAREDVQEAISFYGAVTDVNPFRVDAYRERGMLRAALGDEAGAREDAERADEYAGQALGGVADIEEKVKQAYKDVNPMGL